MIMSTPIDGGHYFIDVFAGIAIAVICLIVARRVTEAARRNAQPAAAMAPRFAAGEWTSDETCLVRAQKSDSG